MSVIFNYVLLLCWARCWRFIYATLIFFFNLKKNHKVFHLRAPSHTCWASAICGVLLVNGIMEPSVGVFHFLPLLCLTIPVITAFILLPMSRTNYLISNKLSKFTLTGKIICITMIQMQECNKSKKKIISFIIFVLTMKYKLCSSLWNLTQVVPTTRFLRFRGCDQNESCFCMWNTVFHALVYLHMGSTSLWLMQDLEWI